MSINCDYEPDRRSLYKRAALLGKAPIVDHSVLSAQTATPKSFGRRFSIALLYMALALTFLIPSFFILTMIAFFALPNESQLALYGRIRASLQAISADLVFYGLLAGLAMIIGAAFLERFSFNLNQIEGQKRGKTKNGALTN